MRPRQKAEGNEKGRRQCDERGKEGGGEVESGEVEVAMVAMVAELQWSAATEEAEEGELLPFYSPSPLPSPTWFPFFH